MTDTMKQLDKITKRIPLLLEERDHLIYQAKKEGATVVAIAEAADLSRAQVHRILSWRGRPGNEDEALAEGAEDEPGELPQGATIANKNRSK